MRGSADTEPDDGELSSFVNAMLANLEGSFRDPEVIAETIRDHRPMWVALYRASFRLDSDT